MKTTKDEARRTVLSALVAAPFIFFFIYQLVFIWPQRPSAPDAAHGFTMAMHSGEQTYYISAVDLVLLLGTWLAGAAIILIGNWPMIRRRIKNIEITMP